MQDIADTETTTNQCQLLSNVTAVVLNAETTCTKYFSGEICLMTFFKNIYMWIPVNILYSRNILLKHYKVMNTIASMHYFLWFDTRLQTRSTHEKRTITVCLAIL